MVGLFMNNASESMLQ